MSLSARRAPQALSLWLSAALASASFGAGLRLEIESGRAFWKPGGIGKAREAHSRLLLVPEDWIEIDPETQAQLLEEGKPPIPLEAPGTYRVHPSGVEKQTRSGWSHFAGSSKRLVEEALKEQAPEPAPASPSRPKPGEFFASVRPVGGPVWIQDPQLEGFTEVLGRESLRPGTTLRVEPGLRAVLSARDDFQVRVLGPAEVRVERRGVHVHHGRVAVQVDERPESLRLTTPKAKAEGRKGLVLVEEGEEGSVFYSVQGVWKVTNKAPEPLDPFSLYLPANKHSLVVSPRSPPRKPLRFDPETMLPAFLENWKQDQLPPPAPIPAGPEDDEALAHFRSDQVRPPPEELPLTNEEKERGDTLEDRRADDDPDSPTRSGRPKLSERDRKQWLRLRVLSSRSSRTRQHFLRYRRSYADRREHPLPPGETDLPYGMTPGAKQEVLDEQEAFRVARHAQNLRRQEVKLHQADQQRRHETHADRERFLREAIEEAYSYQPLRMQTRARLGPTRTRVGSLIQRAEGIDQQIRGISGNPAFQDQLEGLRKERDALLREADRRKDQLEEWIELH